jgi:hypothetical protein
MADSLLKAALLKETAPNAFGAQSATPSIEHVGINQDLLRGAGEIVTELYGADTPANRRRLYHEQNRWPLFRLEDDGVLYALRSRLRSFIAAKANEREAQIAAAHAFSETEIPQQPKRRHRRGHKAAASNLKRGERLAAAQD